MNGLRYFSSLGCVGPAPDFGSETAVVLLIRLARLKPLHAAVIAKLFPNSTFRNRSQRPSGTINHFVVEHGQLQ